jgi:hypothetical protein
LAITSEKWKRLSAPFYETGIDEFGFLNTLLQG